MQTRIFDLSTRPNANNPFYPFKTSTYEASTSLILAEDLKWDAFEANGFLGNGHDWTRLIQNLVAEELPEKIDLLTFDSEADMFCVTSENQDILREIAQLVSKFYDNEAELIEHIKRYAQYGE